MKNGNFQVAQRPTDMALNREDNINWEAEIKINGPSHDQLSAALMLREYTWCHIKSSQAVEFWREKICLHASCL